MQAPFTGENYHPQTNFKGLISCYIAIFDTFIRTALPNHKLLNMFINVIIVEPLRYESVCKVRHF